MSDHNDNILTDQPSSVTSGTNAKHIGLGIGIAILVLAVVGALVFVAFTLVKRKCGKKYSSRRTSGTNRKPRASYTSRPNIPELPATEARTLTPTTSSTEAKKKTTWDSDSSKSSKSGTEIEVVKKPEAVVTKKEEKKGSDNNV